MAEGKEHTVLDLAKDVFEWLVWLVRKVATLAVDLKLRAILFMEMVGFAFKLSAFSTAHLMKIYGDLARVR